MLPNLKRSLEAESSLTSKRARTSPLPTPPSSDAESPGSDCKPGSNGQASVLERASHILTVQATALSNLADLYRAESTPSDALVSAVDVIVKSQRDSGKLVFCAVGKSAHIARKLSATCKSLGIRSTFLHGCEAVHGDVGDVDVKDVLLFVSFSGRTPELLNLLPHLPSDLAVMAISGRMYACDCALLANNSSSGILLPAPVCESEEQSFGVAAPTTSAMVALAVGDMLALMLAEELHGDETKAVFTRHHPGGAIGINAKDLEILTKEESFKKRVQIADS